MSIVYKIIKKLKKAIKKKWIKKIYKKKLAFTKTNERLEIHKL